MPFVKIDSLVKKSIKKSGLGLKVQSSLAIERADYALKQFLGQDLSEYVRPGYIKYKTLNIACLNASAAANIGSVQKEVIEYVNSGFELPIIDKIRIIS